MIVALTVLALLMLIGGLAAMVQGIPFVRLEVGWTMVIAGTVGASAGAVLLGITAAVARLGRIERALTGGVPGGTPGRGSRSRRDRSRPGPGNPQRAGPVARPAADPVPGRSAAYPRPAPAEPTGLGGRTALAAGAAVAAAGLAASELRLTRPRTRRSRRSSPSRHVTTHPSMKRPGHAPAPSEVRPQPKFSQVESLRATNPRPRASNGHEPVAREPAAPAPMPPEPAAREPVPPPPAEEPRPEPPHEPAPPPPPPPPSPSPRPLCRRSPPTRIFLPRSHRARR